MKVRMLFVIALLCWLVPSTVFACTARTRAEARRRCLDSTQTPAPAQAPAQKRMHNPHQHAHWIPRPTPHEDFRRRCLARRGVLP